jgi:diguanylate cyclase (GGDEF)-like protein
VTRIAPDPTPSDAAPASETHLAPEIQLVRMRLSLVISATFVIALLTGGTLVAVFAPWVGGRLEQLLGTVPLPGWVTFAAALVSAIVLVGWMAREVVRPAEELAASRHDLGQLYESARTHALEDSLTGLANHRAFQEEFERQLSASARYHMPVALLLIDLDDFKTVNDSAGHAAGDDLLVEVGRLVRSHIRQSDQAFRIGGDEFAVLMPHCDAESATIIANRLLAACLEPRPASGFPRGFAFSAGATSAPDFGTSRDQLFAQADEALYRAKRDGRCTVRVYDPSTAGAMVDARALAERSAAVAEVIHAGGLHPVYQPIVDLASGQVVAFEGLIRLPEDAPFNDSGQLFRAAEASGRTYDLDIACIAAVVDGASSLDRRFALSINVSPRTLEAPEFMADRLVAQMAAAGWQPDQLIVEVTEREPIEDVDRIRTVLSRLQSRGVRTAADDVGAGNAGLRLLSQIHFDIVKLDLSLVQEGAKRETSLAVIRSLSDLAARWGAMVVAEGVETPAQLHVLRTLNVPLAQGYLLGRPAPVPDQSWVDLDEIETPSDRLTRIGFIPVGAER